MKENIKIVLVSAIVAALVATSISLFTFYVIAGKVVGGNNQPLIDKLQDALGAGTRFIHGLGVGPGAAAPTNGELISTWEFVNGSSTEKWIDGTIAAGTDYSYWKNTTGAIVYADYGIFGMETGVASSTFNLIMFATSTLPEVAQWNADIIATSTILVSQTTYATSTAATSTNSYIARGNGTVKIFPNQFLVSHMRHTGPCGVNGLCEQATSTNRGFNPFWRAHYKRN